METGDEEGHSELSGALQWSGAYLAKMLNFYRYVQELKQINISWDMLENKF